MEPKGQPEDQIDWLRRVVERRRWTLKRSIEATIRENLDALLASGTTLVADITGGGASWEAIAEAPVRGVVFSEVLGLKRNRGLETWQSAWDWIATVNAEDAVRACARPGLAPHAPYSTAGWLYHRAAEVKLPLTTHLAEIPEERELLAHGTGRLREFFEELGAWDDDWEPIGRSPADTIRKGDLRRTDWLVAHGTYLEPSEFWQFRPEAAPDYQRVAIAFCPRTHARFGHAPHPFRAMLDRGVVVCLGTDSRASTPSLSILDEARFLRSGDDPPPGRLLLAMSTLFGAWALRADTVTGSLKTGKSADLAVVALPDREADDPHDLIFDAEGTVLATAFEGRFRRFDGGPVPT